MTMRATKLCVSTVQFNMRHVTDSPLSRDPVSLHLIYDRPDETAFSTLDMYRRFEIYIIVLTGR